MKISAGIFITCNNKILLCHPTTLGWTNSFSIPKGGVNDGESLIDAAIRETKEEVGITITKDQISNLDNPIEIQYISKKNELFKKVYVFISNINDISDIGLSSEILDTNQLQLSEVDWAGFIDKEESSNKIFFRFKSLLNYLKDTCVI